MCDENKKDIDPVAKLKKNMLLYFKGSLNNLKSMLFALDSVQKNASFSNTDWGCGVPGKE